MGIIGALGDEAAWSALEMRVSFHDTDPSPSPSPNPNPNPESDPEVAEVSAKVKLAEDMASARVQAGKPSRKPAQTPLCPVQ